LLHLGAVVVATRRAQVDCAVKEGGVVVSEPEHFALKPSSFGLTVWCHLRICCYWCVSKIF